MPAEKTVLETILEWSLERPDWQRDALRRVVAKGRLDAGDVSELVQLCKRGRGATHIGLAPVVFAKSQLPANPGQGDAVSLASIADVHGVNFLATGQTVEFEPNGLTVIYGDNGAGKSGYARILKRACRARHPGKIEPNVYDASAPRRASATIAFAVGHVLQPAIKWQDASAPHPILSAVSVFDRECASIHITEKNEVAFRPFGVDVPDELAGVCQSVKDALAAEKRTLETSRSPILGRASWGEGTAVGKLLASLKHDTDLKTVAALAKLSDEERLRLERLKEDLSKNPSKSAAEQGLRADNVARLLSVLTQIEGKTADVALAEIFALQKDATLKRAAATVAAEKAFSSEPLEGIGGELWRALWASARRYSTEVAYAGRPFPASGGDVVCVLCQQPLERDAAARMVRFEDYIQRDTERQAQEAEVKIVAALKGLGGVSIRVLPLRGQLQELTMQDPSLARQFRRSLAAARLRRYALAKAIAEGRELQLPDAPPSPRPALVQLELSIRKYAAELEQSAKADERKKLESELAELADRVLLQGMTDVVRDEVARLKSLKFLDECLGETATNAITKLGNDIADTAITPKLRDRFQEEIVKLAAEKVRVEIVRSGGRQGSPQYQVRLFANPAAKVQQILSEGEQTCVALAAFLTELATSAHRSTLVFDDPVSSLDHRWRSRVASRLIEEAAQRQIVVFTHDLIFVNDLDDLAEKTKTPARFITVQRGSVGAGVIGSGLPWKGKSVEDRIDKLEKAAREAKTLHDANDEAAYGPEAASIYNRLRASWERALEDIVFARVIRRHRDYIDTKDLKKVTALTESDAVSFLTAFKRCSDIVDAHDPSSGRNAAPPTPAEIFKDIQLFKGWVANMRDKQKKIA